jgi:aspartyl-tRNA(Asn)/glutamyl-tRNA(Gln) amidotransferase subunit A
LNGLYGLKAWEIRDLLKRGEASAVEVLDSVSERVMKVEDRVNSYITMTLDDARKAAEEADLIAARKETPGRAAGVPMAVKDVLCTRGIRTTCGSHILENFMPVYDATVMEALRREGLVMVGKANMDEFAMGSSTENSAYGPTCNPWDLERVPGGSSGGSAAAVAAGEAIWALGSDTGGSIRQPASLCGLVGLKPTYGLVSRYGLVAFASSLDQVGTITRDVRDCALLLSLIAGHDPRDSTSLQVEIPDYRAALQSGIKGIKVGIPRELMQEGLTPGVKEAVDRSLNICMELGAEVEETTLPHVDYALSAYYIIAPAEASSNLARFDGVRYGYRAGGVEDMMEMYGRTRADGFGAEVKRRIMLGTYALSAGYYEAYYGQAQKIRTLIVEDFNAAFEKFDVLLSPTSPTPAFRLGEKVEDPLTMYLSDVCTIPVNLAGIPAMSIPCGLEDGLPVGLQVMGKVLDEAALLAFAATMEEALDFKQKPDPKRGVGS